MLLRVKIINWLKRGESSMMMYLAFSIVAVAASALMVQSTRAYRDITGAQLLSDITADGAAAQNDSGWGFTSVDEENGQTLSDAYDDIQASVENLVDLNTNDDAEVDSGFNLITSDSYVSNSKVKKSYISKGVVNANIEITGKSITPLTQEAGYSVKRDSATKLSYSGGIQVVLKAYMYSKQAYESHYPIYDKRLRTKNHPYTKYVWAAGRTEDAYNFPYYADCSGFVYTIFRLCGYSVGTWTGEMQTQGVSVSESEARPGDIILYYKGGDPISEHVGIYAGKNKQGVPCEIDCTGGGSRCTLSNPGAGVRVATVAQAAGGRRVEYRRIIKSNGEETEVPEIEDTTEMALFMIMEGGTVNFKGACAILGNFQWESGGTELRTFAFNGNPASEAEMKEYAKSLSIATPSKLSSARYRAKLADAFEMDLGKSGWKTDGGFGIAQWTNSSIKSGGRDGRKTGLWNMAYQMGCIGNKSTVNQTGGLTSLFAQIAFLLKELEERPHILNYINSHDVAAGARGFFMMYEAGRNLNDKPPDGTTKNRVNNAVRLYQQYSSKFKLH